VEGIYEDGGARVGSKARPVMWERAERSESPSISPPTEALAQRCAPDLKADVIRLKPGLLSWSGKTYFEANY